MLQSATIQKRQSEIREKLAGLSTTEQPGDEQVAEMRSLDEEYQANEAKYRSALIAEDSERQQAAGELETRDGKEWGSLVEQYEVRQAITHLDEGAKLTGATAEITEELRQQGGYRGCPLPLEALEIRAGETVAGSIPDPRQTAPIIDRLFPESVAGRMGAQMVSIASGEREYPVSTSGITAGWSSSETGDVSGPQAYSTTDRVLQPRHNLGIQARITRRSMKQSSGIEGAIRRDLRSAIQSEVDKVVFQGAGSSGEPAGVISNAGSYGIGSTAIDAPATWSAFREAVVTFLQNYAAGSPGSVSVMLRPEVWSSMDDTVFDSGSGITEFNRLANNVGGVVQSANTLAAPSGSPASSNALLTTNAGGQSPMIVGMWGGLDLVRDPYSDAQSGGLRITAITTLDVTISRSEQLQILTGIE